MVGEGSSWGKGEKNSTLTQYIKRLKGDKQDLVVGSGGGEGEQGGGGGLPQGPEQQRAHVLPGEL